MRSTLFGLVIVSASLLAHAQSIPNIPFSASSPLTLPPDVYFGEVAGVALNSKHHVFVFTRGSAPGTSMTSGRRARLFEFQPNGVFAREIGATLPSMEFAHSVRIDSDDNIWLVDAGSDLVVKLDSNGGVKLVLGRGFPTSTARGGEFPGPSTQTPPAVLGMFRQPTDVAFDAAGNIFVSDGYINSNVHKFDKYGNGLKLIGTFGSGPAQFKTPHSIAVDRKGLVYVADRQNGRIQVFDNDLRFLREIRYQTSIPTNYVAPIPDFGGVDHQPELSFLRTEADEHSAVWSLWPNALCITPANGVGEQFLYTHDMFPGNIQKFTLDGKLVGEVHAGAGRKLGQMGWTHALACVSENELWIGEILNWRVQRFVLHSLEFRQ